MTPIVGWLGYVAWLVFIASWWIAALWVGKATAKAAMRDRSLYMLGFIVGFTALFTFNFLPGHGPNAPLWQAPAIVSWLLFVAELGGFAFGWWARLHLGRLWSGMMTLREGHRVVDSGPYGWVRHPIYTAFIGSAWAYALIIARPSTLFGALVLTVVMAVKGKAEEGFLRRELGAADYDAYAARVPMLVPFWPVRRIGGDRTPPRCRQARQSRPCAGRRSAARYRRHCAHPLGHPWRADRG
jgi:protein-S-isoprenylcysteine O-methyltransferase Ste14